VPQTDPRVDAYIAKSAEFARPILEHLRDIVHRGCPEVVETIKWGMPFFDHHGPLAMMAAFKEHCAFGFWKAGDLLPDPSNDAMGQFGRIGAVRDLPAKRILVGYVREAARRNEAAPKKGARKAPGAKAPPRQPARRELRVPDDLAAAFRQKKHAKARATFEGLSPSHRREYVEWIEEAKREVTREKRLATTLEWLAEGKPRNWKYVR